MLKWFLLSSRGWFGSDSQPFYITTWAGEDSVIGEVLGHGPVPLCHDAEDY